MQVPVLIERHEEREVPESQATDQLAKRESGLPGKPNDGSVASRWVR